MLVRVKGVKRAKAKGRVYFYHRATGLRINAEPGSAAFVAEVARLDGMAVAAPAAQAGTLGALVAAYRASPEFAGLAARTRADYDRVFDYLAVLGPMPVRRMDAAFVLGLRDRAHAARKRRFANYVLAVLSLVCSWGRPRGWLDANPAEGVPIVARPKSLAPANRAWRPAELVAVLAAAPEGMRAAVALGAFAGLREADALRFPWSGYNGAEVEARHAKTGEVMWMPAQRPLRAILDATPRRAVQVVTGQRGLPLTVDGFRTMFFRLLRELEAAGKVGSGLTFHGLRHTIATNLAEIEGVAERDIMAVTGHRSTSSVRPYVEGADRRRRARAAIAALERIEPQNGKPAGRVGKPRRPDRAK